MTDQIVQWIAPAPLWPALAGAEEQARRATFRRPAILSFTSDLFMDEFMALVANDPARLGAYEARPETWREPAPLPDPVEMTPRLARPLNRLRLTAAQKASEIIKSLPDLSSTRPLKLYQPAHQRHYLVTACLVCRIPGLPDRVLDVPNQERASFVLRRLFAAQDAAGKPVDVEYAMVTTPRGSQWEPVSNPLALADDEERLPLFGVNYVEDDGRRRRLLAGTVPVGRREHYMGAPPRDAPAPPPGAELPADSRHAMRSTQILEPWRNVIDIAARAVGTALLGDEQPEEPERLAVVKDSRAQVQTLSWYILLDFANYLIAYVSEVGKEIAGKPASPNDKESALINALKDYTLSQAVIDDMGATSTARAASLYDALKQIADPAKGWEAKLDAATAAYQWDNSGTTWPDFLFPLADYADLATPAPANRTILAARANALKDGLGDLDDKLKKALPDTPSRPIPPLPLAAQPILDAGGTGRFVIRCVFERPHCGPLQPPVVSEPSAEFQLAGFFDTDAPARPIRIALPIDTTTGGLRKFDKNTAFMISDVLACQIERARGITFGDLVLSVLPWPFHKDLPDPGAGPCKATGAASMGMICTLSIPIITICALILLIIIVTLLDIIFKWIPFFIACFPLPGFKAKK